MKKCRQWCYSEHTHELMKHKTFQVWAVPWPCYSRCIERGVRWLECRKSGPPPGLHALTRSPHNVCDHLFQPPHFTRGEKGTGYEQADETCTQRLDSHSGSWETMSTDSRACDLSTTLCWYAMKINHCGFLSLSGSRLSSLCPRDVPRMWDGKWGF